MSLISDISKRASAKVTIEEIGKALKKLSEYEDILPEELRDSVIVISSSLSQNIQKSIVIDRYPSINLGGSSQADPDVAELIAVLKRLESGEPEDFYTSIEL